MSEFREDLQCTVLYAHISVLDHVVKCRGNWTELSVPSLGRKSVEKDIDSGESGE